MGVFQLEPRMDRPIVRWLLFRRAPLPVVHHIPDHLDCDKEEGDTDADDSRDDVCIGNLTHY